MGSDLTTSVQLGNGKTITLPSGLYINGEWVKPAKGVKLDVYNPATNKVIAQVYEGDAEDVDVAVKAARAAFEKDDRSWGFGSPQARAALLNKLADLVDANAELLAAIESTDQGKTYTAAIASDIPGVSQTIRYYAGWADKITGKTYNSIPGTFSHTRYEPIGVCGQIIPWNFPALMFAWKIAPALATGNTVVMKTAETTPLSALKLAELIHEAGFPPGTFNLVTGRGPTAGQAIADHMDIDKVAFTGSTFTGRRIMESAAKSNLKKVTLELGGKSPNIIFDDVKSVQEAAEWAVFAIGANVGQVCTAGSRLLVQETIAEEFTKHFVTLTERIKVGDPFDAHSVQGPLNSAGHFDKVKGWIATAVEDGATVATGGKDLSANNGGGYFLSPTVFTNVKTGHRILENEVFGPVVSIQTFKTEEEAVEIANSTTYGLAAGVFSDSATRLNRLNSKIRAGTVWNNLYNFASPTIPFGGYKQSGIGRENGEAALLNYLEIKSVIANGGAIRSPFAGLSG
ncbi:Aldehyde dehydrogenase [Vanrija pseudolonga]|uniref:Aldehyde dehydrogenase n=1 Tax=Vanrija pseudolonga TaxID=143232 RepID=A0AAF1BML8_9TREE|nr:Aldehyde dehydrogenase [Vanrija pseudolonga]